MLMATLRMAGLSQYNTGSVTSNSKLEAMGIKYLFIPVLKWGALSAAVKKVVNVEAYLFIKYLLGCNFYWACIMD